MTATSLLPDAARAAGLPFPELCAHAVYLALGVPTDVTLAIEV
jgi:D-alanine-D-alanine ligase-like ATP-grasp enzyme